MSGRDEELEFCIWLDRRTRSEITRGETTPAVRRERAREVLLQRGPGEFAPEVLAKLTAAFQRIYGQPLAGAEGDVPRGTSEPGQLGLLHENGDGV